MLRKGETSHLVFKETTLEVEIVDPLRRKLDSKASWVAVAIVQKWYKDLS